jgi:hypothetical protein
MTLLIRSPPSVRNVLGGNVHRRSVAQSSDLKTS